MCKEISGLAEIQSLERLELLEYQLNNGNRVFNSYCSFLVSFSLSPSSFELSKPLDSLFIVAASHIPIVGCVIAVP